MYHTCCLVAPEYFGMFSLQQDSEGRHVRNTAVGRPVKRCSVPVIDIIVTPIYYIQVQSLRPTGNSPAIHFLQPNLRRLQIPIIYKYDPLFADKARRKGVEYRSSVRLLPWHIVMIWIPTRGDYG